MHSPNNVAPVTWRKKSYRAVMRRARPWFFLAHVTVRPLQADPLIQPPPGIEIRDATQKELMSAAQEPDMLLNPGRINEALGRGDVCTAAFDGTKMVGYTWISFGRTSQGQEVGIDFSPPYRYGYKSFVRPEYRGRRINNALALSSDAYCIDRGFHQAIAYVETHNYASIQSSRRQIGRVFVGLAGYLTCLGRTFTFRTPAVRKLGFRFTPPER